MYIQVKPVIDHSVRAMCAMPYPGHPDGCPSYGKRDTCPPNAPLFDEHYDTDKTIYAVYTTFDLQGHVEKMRNLHPTWTDEELRAWDHWYQDARDALRSHIADFQKEFPQYEVVKCPEAMGVNITETMKRAGIDLEWQQPIKTIYRIALAAIPKK